MTKKTNVVVIGGGYAGVIAANHLRLNPDIAITLINPRPKFVERIRLHQLVTGSDDAVVDYTDVLGADVRLLVDTAERIDAPARTVTLGSGDTIGYDYLDLRGRKHRRRADCSRRRRIRLPHLGIGARRAVARGDGRGSSRGAGDGGRRGPDGSRDRRGIGRAGPGGHPGVRRRARPLPERARPQVGRQADEEAGRDRPGRAGHQGDRGAQGCGGAGRRSRTAQRHDHLDGRVSACPTWPPAADLPPTRSGGCSPTRR